MDAYIASNSPDLSALLARINITDEDRAQIVTPVSSPRLTFEQRRRTSQGSNSVSAWLSPTGSSEYGDSSFERSLANLTFEEIAVLSGNKIVEISTDEGSGEPPHPFHSSMVLNVALPAPRQ